MKYENINLELFKKLLEHKKKMYNEELNGSNGLRKYTLQQKINQIDFCLDEIDSFIEGLADDERDKKQDYNESQ